MVNKNKLQITFGLPVAFQNRFYEIYPQRNVEAVYQVKMRYQGVRFQRLHPQYEDVKAGLLEAFGDDFQAFAWASDCGVIPYELRDDTRWRTALESGVVYYQNPTSMLVAWLLDPQPGEDIWDVCAAPGSKFCHVADLMNNQGTLVGSEAIRNRFYKWQSIVSRYHVHHGEYHCKDARRITFGQRQFDRIVLDAPCSSEGRFVWGHSKSWKYWSERKVREMRHKQKGLFNNALRYLKPGGRLVYATCTLAPEENEQVVDYILKRQPSVRLIPIANEWTERLRIYYEMEPGLTHFRDKQWREDIKSCVRFVPNERHQGFFIAILQKHQPNSSGS